MVLLSTPAVSCGASCFVKAAPTYAPAPVVTPFSAKTDQHGQFRGFDLSRELVFQVLGLWF